MGDLLSYFGSMKLHEIKLYLLLDVLHFSLTFIWSSNVPSFLLIADLVHLVIRVNWLCLILCGQEEKQKLGSITICHADIYVKNVLQLISATTRHSIAFDDCR